MAIGINRLPKAVTFHLAAEVALTTLTKARRCLTR